MDWKMFVRTYSRELLSGALGGVLLALSFPPFPTRYCALIALVPVFRYFLITAGENFDRPVRRAFVLGYTLGIAFFLILLYWVSILIPASSARMPWLMIPATVLLVLYLSCYTALFTIVQSLLLRRFGTSSLFAAPALWSLLELARSRGELGFPWGNLSSALVRVPVTVQGVAVYGPFGLSLIVVLVSVLFAVAMFGRSAHRRAVALVIVLIIAAGHVVWGITEIERFDTGSEKRGRMFTAVIVQPNVNLAIKWEAAYRDTIFQEIEALAAAAATSGARLVIFPETAAPISFGHQASYVRWLKRIARDNDIDLFTGFIDHTRENDEWHPHNAAGLFGSEGDITGYYIKVNLLPFGERMPFSQYIPALSKLDFGQANFRPGTVQTIFRSRGLRFGALICYESIFADYTRRYVRDGADFLVNITNDGWFGSRVGARQHAEAAILRAVENRVPLLRAANSGISMVVDPVGRVTQSIGLDREGMIATPVYPKRGLTIFTRYGHAVYFLMVVANLAAVAIFLFGRRALTKKSVLAVLCTLCLTAGMNSTTRAQGNAECLGETFRLYQEVNLDVGELARASAYLEGGDSVECEREIISYFESREPPCRLERWGTSPDAEQEAEAILNNYYKFWVYDRYELPANLTWRENPASSRNWVYHLLSFEFLGILNDAYALTGDPRYLERGAELIVDFVNDNYDPASLPSRDLSWHEHTAANRLLVLLDFWRLFQDGVSPEHEFTKLFLDLVWRHARFLAHEENYSAESNHGLFSAAALLRISLMFPEFRSASAWRMLAVKRMEEQLIDNVSDEGVHREYSPWYHIWAAGVTEQFRRDCNDNGLTLSERGAAVHDRMLDCIPYFFHPDGTISLFGDSDAYPSESLQYLALSRVPEYRYIRSKGRHGPRPDEPTRAFRDAGIFVMRSGWGEVRPLREETCLIANFSGEAKQHDHYDTMSFEFFARGQKWITDSGRWTYEYSDIRREFIVSPMAHNILVPHRLSQKAYPANVVGGPRRIKQYRVSKPVPDELVESIEHVSLDDSLAVQEVLRVIREVPDIDVKIEACFRMLGRGPRRCTDEIKLLLASCFGDGKGDITTALQILDDIVKQGSDTGVQKRASELTAVYRRQREEYESTRDENRTDDKFENLAAIDQFTIDTPTVFHWISQKEYDYLEGGMQCGRDHYWSRAFLFIKPHCLLIIDAMWCKLPDCVLQLFHMPPSVSVTSDGDRYLLSNGDSLRCIIKGLFLEPFEAYRIVEGEEDPWFQGWYSDTFFTLRPAPVIENLFKLDNEWTYLATLIVPIGGCDPRRYDIRMLDAADWNIAGPGEPLRFEILEDVHRTTVTCMPSSRLCRGADIDERDPIIEVERRMR